jgi:tRNA pseudouridine13 synthase
MDSLKLPYATPRLSGIGGRIRELCEDFIVEEIPVYEPEGAGEHLFVNMTRRDMSTRDVARGLATLFDLPRKGSRVRRFKG